MPLPGIIGRASAANAKDAFKGEQLVVCTWSGVYEDAFKKAVVNPFNERYGTKTSTVGGWDQMAPQMKAAPPGKPPFDITIVDEYTTVAALADDTLAKTDRSKVPNISEVQPWYIETRPEAAREYGVPLGLGFLLPLINTEIAGNRALSWTTLWDKDLQGKLALDAGAFVWIVAVAAIWGAKLPIEALYDWKPGMKPDPIFDKLEELRPAKWYRDGAELSFLMVQEQASVAEIYSLDALGLVQNGGKGFKTGVPEDGTVAYTDWYSKVKGTQHDELADAFLNYLLEKETQDRLLAITLTVLSRKDVTVPPHWPNYPKTNEDLAKRVKLISMEGWQKLLPNFDAFDTRFKEAVLKTSRS
jgi:spermidine/putrescine transport system substrate-binding protein